MDKKTEQKKAETPVPQPATEVKHVLELTQEEFLELFDLVKDQIEVIVDAFKSDLRFDEWEAIRDYASKMMVLNTIKEKMEEVYKGVS